MVAVPGLTPVTMPVEAPTEATSGLLLLHVPPEVGSVRVVVRPTHNIDVPLIGAGNGFTVMTAMAKHPDDVV